MNNTAFPDIKKAKFQEFVQQFHRMLAYYDTNVDAYEAVERQYEKQHGKRKYSNYDSFRTVMARKHKEKKKINESLN